MDARSFAQGFVTAVGMGAAGWGLWTHEPFSLIGAVFIWLLGLILVDMAFNG